MLTCAGLPSGSYPSLPWGAAGVPGYAAPGQSAQVAAGLPGQIQASAGLLSLPGAVPGAIPGTVQGAFPGGHPAAVSGVMPGFVPGSAACAVPGANPGIMHVPGTGAGMPGCVPGVPGAHYAAAVPSVGFSAAALGMHGLPAPGMQAAAPAVAPSFPGFAALSNPMLMTGGQALPAATPGSLHALLLGRLRTSLPATRLLSICCGAWKCHRLSV